MPQVFEFLLDHPIVSFFLLGNLLTGLSFHGKVRSPSFKEYATANRSLPMGILMMTFLATRLGSMDLANAGFVFDHGIVETLLSFVYVVSFFFMGTFIAPFFVYFEDCMTLGDLMEKLYGRTVKVATGVLSIIFSVIVLGAQVKAIGLVSSEILGVTPHKAVLWSALVVILYSMWGGMRSVSYTDVPQVIVTLSVLLFITQTLMQEVGGADELIRNLPKPEADTFRSSLGEKLPSMIFWGVFPTFLLTPPIIQRMLIIHDKRKVRRMWYVSAILYGLIRFLVALIGLCVLAKKGNFGLKNGRELLPRVVSEVFKKQDTLKELIFIGLLGVLLSTMDSYLHSMSVVMVQDIIVPMRKFFSRKALKVTKKATYARIGVGVMGCVAIALGFYDNATLEDVLTHQWAVLIFNIILIPLIIGLLGMKTDKASFIGFCVGYLLCLGWAYAWGMGIYGCFFIGMLSGTIVFFGVHYFVNDAFVTVSRSKRTVTEQLWLPSRAQMLAKISDIVRLPLHLASFTRVQVSYYPIRTVAFSVFMFLFYGFSTVTTRFMLRDVNITRFMGAVHIIGIILCTGLLFEGLWHTKLKPYFALYWHFTLLYCLPFSGALIFFKTHEGPWPMLQLFLLSTFLLALVSAPTFVVLVGLGTGMAYAFYSRFVGEVPDTIYAGLSNFSSYTLYFLSFVTLFFKYIQERHLTQKIYLSYIASRELNHEVGDPLSNLGGLGYLLKNAMTDGKAMKNKKGEEGVWLSKKRYQLLTKQAGDISKHTEEVTHEIHHFSNLIQQQILTTFVEEGVSVRSLVEEAIDRLPQKYHKKMDITMECIEDFEANMLASAFPNVILYLVKNAYQHGEASEMVIKIDGKKREVHVQDNGKGIPPEVLPRIFDLFYGTKHNRGIGLYLVKMLIEAAGGKVDCYTKNDGRKSFTDVVMTL